MNGIIILDKSPGMTSHDAVRAVRKVSGKTRVGHAGTLDPYATGILILLLGKATKASRFLMGLEKEYVFTLQLGLETDTLDRWGKPVTVVDAEERSEQDIVEAASKLKGRYEQVAPAVSALKHGGVPLYKLVRRGEDVPTKVRSVDIKLFDILDIHHPFITARVVCSSGTYVRSLARDMGRLLGSPASVFCLRRTRVGTFGLDEAVPFGAALKDVSGVQGVLRPLAYALRHMPQVRIGEDGVQGLRLGRQPRWEDLQVSDLDFDGAYAVLVDADNGVVGIARRTDESDHPLAIERVL